MHICESRRSSISRTIRGQVVGLGALIAILMSFPAAAQTFSASIAGTVTDSTGAIVRGARLQLENIDTKDVRQQASSDDGTYAFNNLLPGTYKLSVSAAGFKDYAQTDMVLRANTQAIINVPLQVGGTSEQVVVDAGGAELLNTASANNPTTLDQVLLESLPNNTLQPLNFVFALAGTTEGQGGMTTRSGFLDQNTSMFGINGGRTGESEILIDGAPSTAIDWGGLMVSPINDSIQEQQVIDNVYDAQYERGGEGVVTLVTKSGTSQYHGEVYDFMRNDGLDANTWSGNNSGSPRGKFHRNQFGADLGGPLWRRHNLFFFGGYEGLRQPETDNSGLQTMPTKAEVGGDFSNTYLPSGKLDVIYNPFSSHLVTASDGSQYYTRDPFPNNQIPSGLIDKVGGAIAGLYPAPNHDSGLAYDSNNFVKQGPGLTANDKFDIRVDWAQSDKHRLFARVSDRVRQDNTPACYLCNGGDEGNVTQDHGEQGVINDTITPNSRWLINFYGAYSHWFEGQTLLGFGKSASAIGLNPDLFQVNTLPLVNASGYYTLGNQYSTFDRYIRYNSTGIVNVSRQFNLHTLKFGFNYDVGMINNREDQPGIFNFDPGMTSCDPHLDANGNPDGGPCKASLQSSTSGNSIASLLLGTGSGGGSNISMDPAFSQHSFGMYLQDEWRATSRLTVNAGLRYENQRPATERHNRIAYFDLKAVNPLSSAFGSTLNGAFEYAGVNGRGRGAWLPDNTNFGPRVGLAYRVTHNLVARIGSGIFFGPASAMLSFDGGGQSPGYTAQTNWNASSNGGYTPLNPVSNPFPQGIQQPTGNQLGAMTYVGSGTSQLWPKISHPTGTLYQWSTDLQYQASPHSVAEIGYTGVRGRHLLFGNPNFDLDQLPDVDLSLGSQLDQLVPDPYTAVITDPNSYFSQNPMIPYNELLRPFPEYTYLIQTRSLPGADSQFDALAAKYTWTFSRGLTSITSYQWSKNLDDGSEALIGWSINDMWRDANRPKLDYSVSTHDVPQSFAEAFHYELPYGHGRPFGGSSPGAVNQILGGWNLSGIIRLSSGLPFPNPVNFGWNPLGNYGFPGPALPNVIGNPRANRSVHHWINQAAFQGVSTNNPSALVACGNQNDQCQPFPYSFGNEGQRQSNIREAATKNLDLGIGKEFGTEKIKAELRGDFLNVFNHPIYGGSYNIEENLYATNFGQVYSTRNEPREIQVALKVRF